jgi:hypothetical protein
MPVCLCSFKVKAQLICYLVFGTANHLALLVFSKDKCRRIISAIFVAPHAHEALGNNAIPHVFATLCAMVAEGNVDTDIVQVKTECVIQLMIQWNV